MRFKLESDLGNGWSVNEVCKKCGQNKSECLCSVTKPIKAPKDHKLVCRLEKRGKKVVTVIGDFFLEEESQKEICLKLKKELSCGGTIKGSIIELQGDKINKAKEILTKAGFNF